MKPPTTTATRRASAETAADLLLTLLTRCGGYLSEAQIDALAARRRDDGDAAALNILLGQLATVPNDYPLPLAVIDQARDVCNLWANGGHKARAFLAALHEVAA